SRVTWIWSAAVFDPALPGRSMMASGSPPPSGPWSANAVSGWKPKVFFQVGAAPSLSNPHRFAGRCARCGLQRPGWSAGGGGALEPVGGDIVGQIADQAAVAHAERDGGELGVQVVDELGDPGLPACGRRGARGASRRVR